MTGLLDCFSLLPSLVLYPSSTVRTFPRLLLNFSPLNTPVCLGSRHVRHPKHLHHLHPNRPSTQTTHNIRHPEYVARRSSTPFPSQPSCSKNLPVREADATQSQHPSGLGPFPGDITTSSPSTPSCSLRQARNRRPLSRPNIPGALHGALMMIRCGRPLPHILDEEGTDFR
jgi:hypothetical protein